VHFVDAKSILSANNGMNLYRGCTHGCIYCDSRSKCYQMQHAFEDVEVKRNAPQLLEQALRHRKKICMIVTGAMSDPYMHCEETLCLTRRCLEIIRQYGFGAAVQTKSDLVLRDLDLFQDINRNAKAVVQMTLTTMDEGLCRIVEPNVCTTKRRVEVLDTLRDAGIPTVVWIAPILPWLNDSMENLDGLLDACRDAKVRGIVCFGMGLTLRDGNREHYFEALDQHFPGLKERYLQRYGLAYELPSPNAKVLEAHFHRRCAELGILHTPEDCFAFIGQLDTPWEQMTLEL